MQINNRITSLAVVAGLAFGGSAFAAELAAGDFFVRAGVANVMPDSDSDPVLGDPNNRVSVDDATSLGLTLTYMLTDHWAVELLGASPFEHDIQAEGGISAVGKAGTTKHLPPTLYAQYYGQPMPNLHLYGGLGINHTQFFDEEASDSLRAALGNDVTLGLEESWGWAVNLGADYDFTDRWFGTVSLWYVDIETTASVYLADGSKADEFDVTIDPTVVLAGVGYRF